MNGFTKSQIARTSLLFALALALSISVLSVAITVTGLAADRSAPSAWAAEPVEAAIKAGFVPAHLQSGYRQPITRAEFSALVVTFYEAVKGEEIRGRVEFSDTKDANAQKAAFIGVMQGVSGGRFDPGARLNRQQAATVLARLGAAIDRPMPTIYASAPFEADFMDISDWAYSAVSQVCMVGIMRGVSADRFAPLEYFTREQSIVTLMRLYQDYEIVYADKYVIAFMRNGVLNVANDQAWNTRWWDEAIDRGTPGILVHGEECPAEWIRYEGRWHYTDHGSFMLGGYVGDGQWMPTYRYKDGVFEESLDISGAVDICFKGDYLYATYYNFMRSIGIEWNTIAGSNLRQYSLIDYSERELGEPFFVYGLTRNQDGIEREWEVREDGVYIFGVWQVPYPNPDGIEERDESGYFLVDLEGNGHKERQCCYA